MTGEATAHSTSVDRGLLFPKSLLSRLFSVRYHFPSIHNHLLIKTFLGVAVFQALICRDTPDVHVEVKESNTPDEISVAAISAKASTTAITHPELGLL